MTATFLWSRAGTPVDRKTKSEEKRCAANPVRSSAGSVSSTSSDEAEKEDQAAARLSLISLSTDQSSASSSPPTPGQGLIMMQESKKLSEAEAGVAAAEDNTPEGLSSDRHEAVRYVLAPEESIYLAPDDDSFFDLESIGLGLTRSPGSIDARIDATRRHPVVGTFKSEISVSQGPFSHHRKPSWVMLAEEGQGNLTGHSKATSASSSHTSIVEEGPCEENVASKKSWPTPRTPPTRPIRTDVRTSSRNENGQQARSESCEGFVKGPVERPRKSERRELGITPKSRLSSLSSLNSTLSHSKPHSLEIRASDNQAAASPLKGVHPASLSQQIPSLCSSTPSPAPSTIIPSRQGTPLVAAHLSNNDELSTDMPSSRSSVFGRHRTSSKASRASSSSRSSHRPRTADGIMTSLQSSFGTFAKTPSPPQEVTRDLRNSNTSALSSLLDSNTKMILGLDDAFWNGSENSPAGYAGEEAASHAPAGLAVSTAEDGQDVCVEANGRSLKDVELSISSSTTHIILAHCNDPDMLGFLERILPIVSRSLLVLDLSHTGLRAMPRSLRLCQRLEELNLSHNKHLQSSAASFEALSFLGDSLRLLILDNCELTMLPGSLAPLRELRMLSAAGNHLTHLPAWLYQLQRLERLSLFNNDFRGPWQEICQTFTRSIVHYSYGAHDSRLAKEIQSANSVSGISSQTSHHEAVSETRDFWSSSQDYEEEVEELAEQPTPSHASGMEQSTAEHENGNGKSRLIRPFVRRMLSGGDLRVAHEAQKKTNNGEGHRTWNALKRKIVRKADSLADNSIDLRSKSSASSLAMSSRASLASTSQVSLLGGEGLSSLLPSSKQLPLSSSPSAAQKRLRRMSFLPFGILEASVNVEEFSSSAELYASVAREDTDYALHKRNVSLLLRYLEDLSDLNPIQRNMRIYASRPTSHLYASDSGASSTSVPQTFSRQNSAGSSSASSMHNESQSHERLGRGQGGCEGDNPTLFTPTPPFEATPASSTAYKDDPHRRLHILREILTTERSYIKALQELVDIYVEPSSEVDLASQLPNVPLHERRKVFGNIEGILHFHQEAFLPALEAAARCATEKGMSNDGLDSTSKETQEREMQQLQAVTMRAAEQVARTFERHVAFFRMYTSYVNNVESAQQRVALWQAPAVHQSQSRLGTSSGKQADPANYHPHLHGVQETMYSLTTKERKRLRTYIQRARLDPKHSQISLEAYLHLPVQRIPRYRLLFEDLVRVCPPERLSTPCSVASALFSISSIATMINESKRQSEMDLRLLQWQERIQGSFPSPLVQPHRKLVHDGPLTLRRIVSRVVSFTVSRKTVLGDVTALMDSYEESAMLQIADAQSKVIDDEAVLQVHHLARQHVQRNVQVILCNDITVIVEGTRAGGPVDLFAVLRATGPARIVNERTLRIADPKHILYLEASTKEDAEAWRKALSSAYLASSSPPSP